MTNHQKGLQYEIALFAEAIKSEGGSIPVRYVPFQIQLDTANINENITKVIVSGVNSLCSSLFFEIAFPNVLKKNNTVISHKA